MNGIKEFYHSIGFVITFMFLTVLISATFGHKTLTKFLLLVLTSQLVINSEEAINLINKLGGKKENTNILKNKSSVKDTTLTNNSTGNLLKNKSASTGNVKNGYLSASAK